MVSAFGCGPVPVARSCLRAVARAGRGSRSPDIPSVRSKDVQRVFDRGRKFHGTRVVVFLAPGTGQFAVVAGRRLGGAVERNRARRILRTAWREVAAPSGYDAVLVAREAIRGSHPQELMIEMSSLLRREGITR